MASHADNNDMELWVSENLMAARQEKPLRRRRGYRSRVTPPANIHASPVDWAVLAACPRVTTFCPIVILLTRALSVEHLRVRKSRKIQAFPHRELFNH